VASAALPQTDVARAARRHLRQGWPMVVEGTLAASVAWVIATRVIGHPQPFFAPAAALIVLGQARGQRGVRALEVVLGVAAGVLVADVVAGSLGRHTTLTVFVIVAVTLVTAVAIGASTVLLVQAAVSALYVAVIAPTSSQMVPFRFVDALVGGGVALVVTQVVRPRNPLVALVARVHDVVGRVAAVLEATADALAAKDPQAAREALTEARGADALVDRLAESASAAREVLWTDLHRRRRLARVGRVEDVLVQVDLVVRTVRVLARAAVPAARLPDPPPTEIVESVRVLASAVRAFEAALTAGLLGDMDAADRSATEVRTRALAAVRTGAAVLPSAPQLPVVMVVGQVRTAAIELLRATGMTDKDSLDLVDEASGLPHA
jgi:uncharacterized membrane protein YgaE (UPF0421/DUF939 family)